jgi:probable addiction module antidote protein
MTNTKATFRRFDAAEYLTDETMIADYLNAAAEENDPALMALALGDIAKARNMSQLARDAGLSREGLYKALSEDGNPSLATTMKVAAALGFHLAFRPIADADKVAS